MFGILCRMSSVYVLPVEHTYVGCFEDRRGDRDLLLVPRVRKEGERRPFPPGKRAF